MSIRHALMRELADRVLAWVAKAPESPERGTDKPLDALTRLFDNRILRKVESPAGPGLDGWTVAVIYNEMPSQDTSTAPQDHSETVPATPLATPPADAASAPARPVGAPSAPAVIASVTWTWTRRGTLDAVTWTGYDPLRQNRAQGKATGALRPDKHKKRAGPDGPAPR